MATLIFKCKNCGKENRSPDYYRKVALKISDITKFGMACVQCDCGTLVNVTKANVLKQQYLLSMLIKQYPQNSQLKASCNTLAFNYLYSLLIRFY